LAIAWRFSAFSIFSCVTVSPRLAASRSSSTG
jgi:hypothetical protein